MGWLSKIFKGSNHKLYEVHSSDGYDDAPVSSRPSISVSEEPDNSHDDDDDDDDDDDGGDIDRAIALSLLEEENKVAPPVLDRGSQVKEDEELARALQESLKVDPPPHYEYGNGSLVQPVSMPYPTGYRICSGCHSEIGFGRILNCMGGLWHPECFRCHGCNSPISGYEFSMYGGYPYHKSCYKEQYHPKCGVCRQFIPTNHAGLIEYRAHPFWDQKYCPAHELDGTPRCCSCERMEAKDTGYVSLADGRKLCLECLDSAVMDTNECQPLYLDIQEFYECLNMRVEQQVPLLLAERQALNEAMEGEKQGHHHMPETRGLCLSEEQTISTVRRQRAGAGTRTMDMITEPYKLTRRCDVTAILVLYGLPRLLTGSILAHEMMHAWLRLKGFRMLNPQIEEGICQVLAYMWLESQLDSASISSNSSILPPSTSGRSSTSSSRSSPFEMKLGQFFRNQIESDISPIYGDGFRTAHQTVVRYGLQRTLDHIQMTGCLPF